MRSINLLAIHLLQAIDKTSRRLKKREWALLLHILRSQGTIIFVSRDQKKLSVCDIIRRNWFFQKRKKFNGIPNLRSEIHQENLFSRHSGNQNHHQSAISQKWDKLEAFLTKKSEEKLKKKSLPQETPKKLEFRDYLDAFQGFTMFLSKDQFLSNINSRKLTMIFLISSISLIVQLMLSKKARKWCYYTLKIIGYIIGFSLSTGSLSLLAIKLHHRYKNKKKIKQELDSCSIEDSDA